MAMVGDEIVAEFVRGVTDGLSGRARRRALFLAVRDMPYATDAASDAVDLVRRNQGNCLAKADLLSHGFRLIGEQARQVRWRYSLPLWPPEVALLPTTDDVHTAVEALVGDDWVLVDATHDPPLALGGLTVADWDGIHATRPNYPPSGPVWRDGEDDEEIEAAVADIMAHYESPASAVAGYQVAFNRWLDSLRAWSESP